MSNIEIIGVYSGLGKVGWFIYLDFINTIDRNTNLYFSNFIHGIQLFH